MVRIAIFASGNGSNFERIVEATRSGEVEACVAVLVCDKATAYVLERAKRLGVEAMVISPKDFASKSLYEAHIVEQLRSLDIDLICLAGYMRIVDDTLREAYDSRIINIHPALLPSFKGAHGIRDAYEYGVKVFGVTVHYVDATVDGGRIIDQMSFYYDGDDMSEVERRIHEVERVLYPRAIEKIITNLNTKI